MTVIEEYSTSAKSEIRTKCDIWVFSRTIEVHVRVTSVTCSGLFSKTIYVSETFLLNFCNFTNASVGIVFYRIIAKLSF